MVDLVHVECFEAVLRTGSFRAAAHKVELSQPSVSAHIGKLERELGLRLFERGPSGTALTVEGERMLPHLRAFAASEMAIRRATEYIQTHAEHELTVFSFRSGLTDILPNCMRLLAESFGPVRRRLTEATHDEVVAGLISGRCDLGLSARVRGVVDAGVESTELFDVGPVALIGRPGNPLFERDDWIDLADLGDVPLVITSQFEPYLVPLLPAPARRRMTVVNNTSVALALFDSGAADLAIVSVGLRVGHDAGIVRRPVVGGPSVDVIVATVSGAPLSPPAAALHEYLLSWGEFIRPRYVVDPRRGVRQRGLDG